MSIAFNFRPLLKKGGFSIGKILKGTTMFWNKLKYKNIMQSGRSMVEIIGVLAVVGVLSIGAVSGYKYGMNRYRANETINELQIRALGLMQQINHGEIVELNMEMGDKTGLGYTTDAWIKETDPKYFYISLAQVPSDVCKQILKEEWSTPTAIYIGNSNYLGDDRSFCGNDTYAPQMDFEFYANFAEGMEYVEEEKYEYAPQTELRHQKKCDDPDNPLGDINGNCYACDYTGSIEVGSIGLCNEICSNRQRAGSYCEDKICPADKPLMDRYGNCHACDTSSSIYVTREGQCNEICSNRQLGGDYCYNRTCPADKPLMDTSGNCYSCNEVSSVYVNEYGKCSEICPNRELGGEYYLSECVLSVCPSNKPLKDRSGRCHACNETNSITIPKDGKCHEVCANRTLTAPTTCAVTKTCPADKPLMDTSGNCHACDETQGVNVGERAQCETICSNRKMLSNGYCAIPCPDDKPLMSYSGNCYACDYDGGISTEGNKCREICPNRRLEDETCLLSCTEDKPLKDDRGYCYSCDTTSKIDVDRGKCSEVCPNRQLGGDYCYNKTCPADKPLMDTSGNCHACDETSSISVGYDGICREICPNRIFSNRSCIIPTCPADKPLMDYRGNCYACDTSSWVDVDEGSCSEICPNRYIDSGTDYCMKGGGACSGNTPLRDGYSCRACNYEKTTFVGDAKCTEVCSNRIKTKDGYCALSCPADKPLMDTNGNCYACDDEASVYVGYNGQCTEICPNRHHNDARCLIETCPADKPLRGSNGTCYSCDTPDKIYMDSYNSSLCEKSCKNRKTNGWYCVSPCPADKPLTSSDGSCYTCDRRYSVHVGSNGKCTEVCPDRIKKEDGDCIIACSSDKPLRDYNGNCYACDSTEDDLQSALEGQCKNACPNRPLSDIYGYCYTCDVEDKVFVGANGQCSEICSNRVKTDNNKCAIKCSNDRPLMHVDGVCYSCETKAPLHVGSGECEEVCANRTKREDGYCYLNEEE